MIKWPGVRSSELRRNARSRIVRSESPVGPVHDAGRRLLFALSPADRPDSMRAGAEDEISAYATLSSRMALATMDKD
jgi:hypothetical protein